MQQDRLRKCSLATLQHRTALTRTTQKRGQHDDQRKPESSRQEHQAGGIDGKSPTDVIRGKLLDCEILIQQAVSNTKEQFASSPDLDQQILNAVMDALASFTSMSRQALESSKIRMELKEILLGPVGLYEALRAKGARRSAS